MLNKVAKILLVTTAVAPIAVTWAFADWRSRGPNTDQAIAVAVALGLAIICGLVLTAAKQQLPEYVFTARAVKPTDSEVIGFLVAYLLPLVATNTTEFDYAVLSFVALLLTAVVWSSESYNFNPLLSFARFHFYEVESTDGVTYLLITRRIIRRSADVHAVAELSGALLLDTTREGQIAG